MCGWTGSVWVKLGGVRPAGSVVSVRAKASLPVWEEIPEGKERHAGSGEEPVRSDPTLSPQHRGGGSVWSIGTKKTNVLSWNSRLRERWRTGRQLLPVPAFSNRLTGISRRTRGGGGRGSRAGGTWRTERGRRGSSLNGNTGGAKLCCPRWTNWRRRASPGVDPAVFMNLHLGALELVELLADGGLTGHGKERRLQLVLAREEKKKSSSRRRFLFFFTFLLSVEAKAL